MTPFGARIRALREARGITLTRMAADIGVSAAYLSAVEHGKRPRPRAGLVRQIVDYFGIIWDEADALKDSASQSNPRVVLDTSGLSPEATAFANLLASRIRTLPEPVVRRLTTILEEDGKPAA